MKSVLKKSLILLLLAALVFVSFNFAFADTSIDDRDYIKVGLYWGNTSKNSVQLECADGFLLYDSNLNLIEKIDDTSLVIDTSSSYLKHKEYVYFMSAAEDEDSRKITLTTEPGSSSSYSKAYRDGIALYENSGLRVVNYVTIEHYTWGVVNREMSSSNPEEALKAQAIAARTYAYKAKVDKDSGHTNYGFDVCTTTDCQVYGAYSSESEKTTAACIATAHEIMVYENEPIHAYFSAASGGGYTQSLYDAWGLDDVPYLKSVRDEYTPAHKWHFTDTFAEIEQKVSNYYKIDLGTIQKFEVTKTNDHGAVTQLTVTGSKGTKVIPRSQIMAVFNLKSTFFVLGNKDYVELTESESSNASSNTATFKGSVSVLSADGLHTVDTSSLYVYNGKTTTKYETTSVPAIINNNSEVCTAGTVYWNGLGYGHGIGMSQTGAIAMAKDYGFTYDQILNYYYSDIDIIDYLDL